jgi:hypothetical protein
MSHSNLKSLDQVAQTICLPNERAPVRLPTYPSIDKTALFRYRYQDTQSLKDDALVTPDELQTLNIPGRKRYLLSRDPAAPLLVDSVHLLQHTWGLHPAAFDGTIFVRGESTTIVDSGAGLNTSHSVDFEKCYPIEYYNTLPAGRLDGKEWFVVPRTLDSRGKSQGFLDRITVGMITENIASPTGADPLGSHLIRKYNHAVLSDGTPLPGNINGVAGELCLDYTITVETLNYMGVAEEVVFSRDWSAYNYTGCEVLDPNVSMVRIKSLAFTGNVHVLNGPNSVGPAILLENCYPVLGLARSGAHIPTGSGPTTFRCLSLPATPINPEYYNSVAPFQSTRLNSSALLLTNVTKVLNKEGTVQSSRLLFNPHAGRTFHHADVMGVSTSNPDTRYFGALEKGAYTFTAPDQESLKFVTPYRSVFINDTGTSDGNIIPLTFIPTRAVERPVLDLEAKYYNCIICSDLDSSDDTQLAMTLDTHWEFRTVSTLYTLDYSRMPMEVYHAAMLAVVKAGFFYENNSHTKILRMLSTGVRYASPMINAYMNSGYPGHALAAGAAQVVKYGATKAHAAYKAHQGKKNQQKKGNQRKEKGNMRQKGLK